VRIFCAQLGVPFNLTASGKDTLVAILERHEFLGTTLYGGYEGIDYSEGKLDERWLSQPTGEDDANVFAWNFQNGEQDWTMKRYNTHLGLELTIVRIFFHVYTRKSNKRERTCATIRYHLKTISVNLQI
jgi:WD40 repeat protein